MTQPEMLELLELALRFRSTPIVDDDFPLMRDRFDSALRWRIDAMRRHPIPRTVCLCGSTRFADAYRDAQRSETLAGRIVLSVGLFGHVEGIDMSGPVKEMLDELHLRKIDQADEILVLNCKRMRCKVCKAWPVEGPANGIQRLACPCFVPGGEGSEWAPYVGDSTRREIAYAESLGKPVRYLNPPEAT